MLFTLSHEAQGLLCAGCLSLPRGAGWETGCPVLNSRSSPCPCVSSDASVALFVRRFLICTPEPTPSFSRGSVKVGAVTREQHFARWLRSVSLGAWGHLGSSRRPETLDVCRRGREDCGSPGAACRGRHVLRDAWGQGAGHQALHSLLPAVGSVSSASCLTSGSSPVSRHAVIIQESLP